MMFVFYLNYIYGWVVVSDLNFYGPPPIKDLGY